MANHPDINDTCDENPFLSMLEGILSEKMPPDLVDALGELEKNTLLLILARLLSGEMSPNLANTSDESKKNPLLLELENILSEKMSPNLAYALGELIERFALEMRALFDPDLSDDYF